MTKIILSQRPFREEFIQQMETIAPDFKFQTNMTENHWSDVVITIGWQEAWQPHLLAQSSNLKWVQSISAGVDYLPLADFQRANILLSNASGIHSRSISDHVLTVILMKLRGFVESIHQQADHQWQRDGIEYKFLSDQRILIVGTGQIGQELARILTLLGSAPIGINTSGHPADHFKATFSDDQLLAEAAKADFIVNILPLTTTTKYLYDERFFDNLKSTASFINVGRGPSVDTEALVRALKDQQLAFAALDVFEEEPLPADHPLWQLKNVLITPHISGMTPHFQQAFMKIFLTNLTSFIKEEKLSHNAVSLTKGY